VFVLDNEPPRRSVLPSIEDVCVVGSDGGGKVGVVEEVKDPPHGNCTLKFSEILLMWLFLNTEKSNSVMPGLIKNIATRIATKVKAGQRRKPGRLTVLRIDGIDCHPKLGGAGSQLAFQKFRSGAVGTEKHSVLI